ncbi:MAG: cytochrome c biogenesis protein CcsA [Pseudomonadota bacterium]|nr:cytochrome c biogenesis protein CcsA [Pseudomonadota bacterium]
METPQGYGNKLRETRFVANRRGANPFFSLMTTRLQIWCYYPHMLSTTVLTVSALLSLLPATILPYRRTPARDALFWILLAVAIAGPTVWVWASFATGWRVGFAPALWLTITASLAVFGVLSAAMRHVWRLAPILLPYMMIIAVMAALWLKQPEMAPMGQFPSASVWFHILLSIVTYGLLTIGAISGFAVTLQERALKQKRPGGFVRLLPSVVDGERIQITLLFAGGVVLACGLVSGMAAQYFQSGQLIDLNHKTVLSLVTLVVIVALLLVHARTGIRGRRAARYVLAAYLLITLAYPGVKFVTDVVLATPL